MDSEVCYSNAAAYAGSVDDGDDDDDDNECCVNAAAHGRRSLHEGKHEQTVEHLMGYMTLSSSTNTTTHRHHNPDTSTQEKGGNCNRQIEKRIRHQG